ncbi:hypothetical protein EPICR_30294 [Candidatus Desulfarcum epimagneticum]|uniref:DUF11 domain-containing protein n=1 Tax=uncultured Desulfobacteraceae bacterium TaxID=218296 RepID=A0A484HHZ1_9BACT|nr:hypothetical protein EPICR_30294 [uncultured Desulfobacteraceae bacterium]
MRTGRLLWVVALTAITLCLFFPSISIADVELTVGKPLVSQCDQDVYTVTVTNPAASSQNLTEMVIQADLKTPQFLFSDDSTQITTPANGAQTGADADPAISGNVLTWDIDALFGADVELAPGQQLTVGFNVTYTCAASSSLPVVMLDGQRPRGAPITQEIGNGVIILLPGAVTISTTPATQVMTLEKTPDDDIASWTLEIKNTGIGNIYHIAVSDTLGAGLDYVPGSARINATALTPADVTGGAISWDLSQLTADPDGPSGLSDLDGDGKFNDLPPGESAIIENVQAQIISCADLTNAADVQYGCHGAEICFDTASQGKTSSGSIAVGIVDPSISYTFDPGGLLQNIDYCGDSDDVRIEIANAAGAGQAKNFQFKVDKMPDGYTITDIKPAGVTYDPATGFFSNMGDIDGGQAMTLTFDATWNGAGSPCDTGTSSASLLLTPEYRNVCDEVFFPPTSLGAISLGPRNRMAMSVEKSGPPSVEVGETDIPFTLTATVSGFSENPSFNSGPVSIIDTIPTNYTVADAAGGAVSGNQITWTHTFSQANPTFSRTVLLNATTDPCDAGKIVSNILTVPEITVTDCRGCDYTIGGSSGGLSTMTHYINQDDPDAGASSMDGASKSVAYLSTQSGGQGEACRDIRYTVTYDLSTDASNHWTGFSFKESLTLAQFLRSVDSVTYNGVDYTAHISTTNNSPGDFVVDLSGLEGQAPAPSEGHALVIVFTTGTVNASVGSSIQFSQITAPSSPSGCADQESFQQGAAVSIGEQSMGISVSGPPLIEHCSIHSHTLSVSKNDGFFAYDPKIILNMDPDNDGKPNFGYISGTTAFSGAFVDTADTSFGAFEPAVSGNQLIWDFSAKGSGDFKTVSDITVQLRFTCDERDADTEDDAFSVKMDYNTFCADNNAPRTKSAGDEYNPDSRFIIRPALFPFQSPDPLYVTKEPEPWALNITNGGDGAAYNVAMVTTVGADIVFDSADIPWADKTGQVYTWRFQLAADPDGPGGLDDLDNDGFYDDLAPAETVSVNVNTSFISCDQLGVVIAGYSSCDVAGSNPLTDQWNQTAYCEGSTPFNAVAVMAPPHVTASNAFGGNLALCAEQEVLLTVKNTGLSRVYKVKAKQSLPDTGVSYVTGSSLYDLDADADGAFESTDNPLGDPVSGDGASGNPYIWNEGQIALFDDMPPGAKVRIKYRVKANCDSVNSDLLFGAQAEWQTACDLGESTSMIAAPITLSEMNVEVVKEARNINTGGALTTQGVYGANGDVIEYRATLNSDGQIAAENIRLSDILPDNVLDLSTLTFIQNPADSGTGSAADPLVWNPSNVGKADGSDDGRLNPNSSFTTVFRVTVDQCGAGTGTGTVSYGCNAPGECVVGAPKEASHQLVVTPDLDTPALSVTGSAGAGALTTRGRMEIRIKNNGGAARNLTVTDTLPTGFVIDPSIPATVTNTDTGAGAVDTVTVGGASAVPTLTLTSSTGSGPQTHLLRHGHTATVALHVVQGAHFDTMENPDDTQETVADGLDPAVPANGVNAVSVAFEDTCGAPQTPETQSIPAQPQTPDLDIVILDPSARIVDVGENESFQAQVENRGESTAQNALLTVTIGDGWSGALPVGCSGAIPGTVACALPDIDPGADQTIPFNLTVDNDQNPLTFHARVDGNIVNGADADTGDNYSLDTHRVRVIGYSLTKNLQSCSEADSADPTVWVGEDCVFRVEAKWFGGGDDTISGAVVTDTLPPGQGYVSHTLATGGGFIAGALDGASPAPVASGVLTWEAPDFNNIAGHQTFRADVVVRTLNEPVNSDAAPVDHGTALTDSVDGSFSFQGVSFNSGTNGFPALSGRERTITVSTPDISIDKQVRNVTQAGSFAETAEGDAGDMFEYRLVVSNGAGRAAAYNLALTETLPAKMNLQTFASDGIDNDQDGAVDEGGGGEGNDNGGGSGQSLRFDDSHNSALARLDPGASATLLYRATADGTVLHQEVIVNTAQVTADTLSGVSGGQNAPQGAPGSGSGARVYTASDGATVNIDSILLTATSKAITATSHTPLGGAAPYAGIQNVVIGEEIRYRLRFVVSPSTMNNWTITDTLPAGVMLIQADPIILPAGFSPGGTITPAISGDNRTVTWDMGSQALSGASTDQAITAEFTARIENLAANQAGVSLTNADAKTRHDDVDTLFDDITVSVLEPQMTLDKAGRNITRNDPDFSGLSRPDAGDILEYRITIENGGAHAATGHDVHIQDTLPAHLTYLSTTSAKLNGSDIPGFNPVPAGAPDGPLVWGRGNGDETVDIPPGGAFVLIYQARVKDSVTPALSIDNRVDVDWTSLDGADARERNGDGGVNDYAAGASAPIAVLNSHAMEKVKTFDGFNTSDAWVRVGDKITYEIRFTLQEAVTENVVVTDTLPSDLTFLRTVSIAGDTTAPYAPAAPVSYTPLTDADTPAPGSTGNLTWDFGRIENPGNNTGTDMIVIVYEAQVTDVTAVSHEPLQRELINTARVDYKLWDGSDASALTSAGQVTLAQPRLSVSKTLQTGQSEVVGGGDAVNFRITATNTGQGPAYNIHIRDELPPEMRSATPATQSVLLNGAPATLAPPLYDADSGTLIWILTDTQSLLPGQDLVIDFQAFVNTGVADGLTLENQALADAYFSKPSSDMDHRRQYGATPVSRRDLHTLGTLLTPNHEKTVQAGASLVYPHEIDLKLGGLTGELDISAPSSQGMEWAIYQDSNDNGELDSSDAPWVNGASVNTGRLRFFLKGVVPTNASDGWLDVTRVEASVTAGGVTQTDTVSDVTRVAAPDAGVIAAYKKAAVDRDCDQSLADESVDDRAFSVFKELDAGHCVVYRIRFVNVGSGTVTNIKVHDQTPAFTVYVGGSADYGTTPFGLTKAGITEQPADGGAGQIVWTYSGGLAAGEEGSVTYEVRSAP